MNPKRLKWAVLVVPISIAAWWWSTRSTTATAESDDARPATIVAPGHVEPQHAAVDLAFDAQGRIVEILVEEGQKVAAGEVLARLDDRQARARIVAAEAVLAQAKARYALARRGPRDEDVDAARAEANAAAAAAAHRGVELSRSKQLGKMGAITSSVVDADAAAARVAAAQASAARARLQSLARGSRPEQVEEAEAAITLAQAELDGANVALDQTVLRAPRDGVIIRRRAEVGTLVTTIAPIPVLTFADLSLLEIRTEIDEADISAIAVGRTAYATADAYGDRRFPVKLRHITRELGRKTIRDDDPRARVDTRVLEVIASFDPQPDIALPVGLRMYVHITGGPSSP